VIVAWAVFLLIKLMNRLKNEEVAPPPAPAEPPEDVKLLREIRDLLKKPA
jgi:large conductance mechanosensitive channel